MRLHRAAAVLAAFAVLPSAADARADASSWMFTGAGAMAHAEGDAETSLAPALSFDVGIGTSPDAVVVLGGLFRLAPLIDSGVDLAVRARGATRGFQAGDFGLALDVGPYLRFWGDETTTGVTGALVLGAPFGITLSIEGLYGQNDAIGYGAIAGIDLARLTVYRQTGLDFWPNPLPAQERSTARAY